MSYCYTVVAAVFFIPMNLWITQKHGISDEDIEESVRLDTGSFSLPGYHPISPHVEQKLRVLYDI